MTLSILYLCNVKTDRLVHAQNVNGTREQIVDAATRLIHLRGFKNTSVEDILRETGVGKGNFYYYFKSKDELGFAALERSLERIRKDLIERSFLPGTDPWVQLETFLTCLVEMAHESGGAGGCPLGNLAVEMSDIHEEFRQRIRQAFDQVRAQIERTLEDARSRGVFRQDGDPSRLASFVLAGIEGAFLMGKLYKNPDLMADVIRELKGHLARYRVA